MACAESTGELKSGHRNRWFIAFTNLSIDAGFVVAALVPMILVLIFSESHLRVVWRMCLGLGIIPPLSLLYLSIKLQEPEEYHRNKMNHYPYWLILKFYWSRLIVVSLIWFIYDFSSYSFWHLLFFVACIPPSKHCTSVEDLWMEHSHQSVLYPRSHHRCFPL